MTNLTNQEIIKFPNQQGINFSAIKYILSETAKDILLEQALVKVFELV